MDENKDTTEEDKDATEGDKDAFDKLKLAGATVGVILLAAWLVSLYPSFMQNRRALKEIEPYLREAKSLGLEYDAVLAGDGKYRDKSVLWCVQNRGEDAVSSQGKRLAVTNYPAMPMVIGDKHAGCADMLLKIEGVRKNSLGGTVLVRFVHKF